MEIIRVTFDESIDKNSVDTGSLSIFVNSGFGNTPDIDSVSVSGKTATFKISPSIGSNTLSPDVSYIASISTNIEDKDGNFLDCFDSKGVDDNCEWEFSTSGSSGSSSISISPTSGSLGTPVTVTGTGFAPNIPVAITFDNIVISGTVTTDGNGKFSSTFNVPFEASIGLDTVRANLASTTFTVTSSTTPIILLDPTSGPVGTLVTVAGINFGPNSNVTIKFGTEGVTTNPSPLKTTSTGSFIGTFSIPISSSIGDNTVTATQGSNSASRIFKVTASTVPVINLNVTSGPIGTPVAVTGNGFAPTTTVTIKFGDTTVANPTSNSNGGFSTSFKVPSSLSGAKTVLATQGSKSASKTFTVTPSDIPTITLNRTSGPVGIPVKVIGSGFDSNAAATINFDGNPVDTIPPTVIANSNGEFSATFKVPESSPGVDYPVVVSQADNSASTTFKVTSTPFAATSRNNVNSFGLLSNQSDTTLVQPPSNQSNASVPVVTNSPSDTSESNSKVTFENNTRPENTSSAQRTDNTSTSPTTKKMNNTTFTGPTDNKVNENHISSASSQTNDTSNIKKSSEKSISISHAKSKDQLTSTKLTTDNSNDGNRSSVGERKTITKVTSPNSDNQPEKQSRSSDSIKKDRALFFKYLNSKNDVKEEDKTEVNNRPVAVNDKATTDANVPVEINILRNDKDSDGDKLGIMGLSPPIKGKIESNSEGVITYTPLESWSGTEKFGYSISDGRGGVATASVIVIVQPISVENQLPEAQDQDVSINGNNPVKIKLDAKDPDDAKLRFVLVSKPSHGRIAQFSSSTGTLSYVPDENYNGKDDFAFKVHDGTAFSKNAKVSIKIENNVKSSNDQVQGNDPQQKKDESSRTPSDRQKTNDVKSNSDNPPNDSSQQSPSSTQDTEQQKKDQKQEEQQPSPAEKHTSDGDSAPSGDSQPTPDS